jgi:Ca2+-binding RTX toxin-like protein
VAIGGADADQFWIANAELPETINVISDYELGVDVIGVAGLGIGFDDLELKQVNDNTVIATGGQDLAILLGTQADSLSADNFAFT